MTASPRDNPFRVAIVGAGLAGIAAAAALVDAGLDVTLIERRKLLGGRATSFEDAATGQLLDNCQHVLLGCCTNLLHLYRRLGIEQQVDFFDRITFANARGTRSSLAASGLPSPLHLAPSMLTFKLLTWGQKMDVARAMASMFILDDAAVAAADNESFAQWLGRHGHGRDAIDAFWNIILISALNEDADHASAKYALQVFRQAFLGHRRGYVMGVPRVPLATLYGSAIATRCLTGTIVEGIELRERGPQGTTAAHGQTWSLTLSSGETIEADSVILATAAHASARLLAPFADRAPSLRVLDRFAFRPILGLHLFYDRPVMTEPHLALVGTELQWLFRKNDAGTHIHGVVSAPDRLIDTPADPLMPRLLREVESILPAARAAKLLRHRVVKEKRATFSPVPGLDRHRPPAATALPGLFLAGDYTQTDWPATMEGAVRSGYLAAEALLRSLGRPIRLLQPDL